MPQQVVRSSGRIPKQIPILLIGSDLDGKVFSESTNTVLLSLHGAGIVSYRAPQEKVAAQTYFVLSEKASQLFRESRPSMVDTI